VPIYVEAFAATLFSVVWIVEFIFGSLWGDDRLIFRPDLALLAIGAAGSLRQ
jgi:hypothetical protein